MKPPDSKSRAGEIFRAWLEHKGWEHDTRDEHKSEILCFMEGMWAAHEMLSGKKRFGLYSVPDLREESGNSIDA